MDLLREPLLSMVYVERVRNVVELHDIDRYAFLVASPLIMVVQGVFVYAFCKFGLYRSSPMDIILLCFVS